MRTKHNPGHGVKGSAAFKPFLTEYRFSFKDPAPTKGKFSLGRRDLKGKLIKPQTAAPVVVAQEKEKTLEGFLPPIPIRNAVNIKFLILRFKIPRLSETKKMHCFL